MKRVLELKDETEPDKPIETKRDGYRLFWHSFVGIVDYDCMAGKIIDGDRAEFKECVFGHKRREDTIGFTEEECGRLTAWQRQTADKIRRTLDAEYKNTDLLMQAADSLCEALFSCGFCAVLDLTNIDYTEYWNRMEICRQNVESGKFGNAAFTARQARDFTSALRRIADVLVQSADQIDSLPMWRYPAAPPNYILLVNSEPPLLRQIKLTAAQKRVMTAKYHNMYEDYAEEVLARRYEFEYCVAYDDEREAEMVK